MLDAINEAICDSNGRPLQNIRIRHTIVLDDPFPDPAPLLDHIPENSPEPVFAAVRTPFLPLQMHCLTLLCSTIDCAATSVPANTSSTSPVFTLPG